MSRFCPITGKRPIVGNKVSHANNKTKRRFLPNLITKKLWLESKKKFIKLKISAKALRTIDRKGLESVLAKII